MKKVFNKSIFNFNFLQLSVQFYVVNDIQRNRYLFRSYCYFGCRKSWRHWWRKHNITWLYLQNPFISGWVIDWLVSEISCVCVAANCQDMKVRMSYPWYLKLIGYIQLFKLLGLQKNIRSYYQPKVPIIDIENPALKFFLYGGRK